VMGSASPSLFFWKNWFHSIERPSFLKNTIKRSLLRKISLKESFRLEKYHSVNFCNEPITILFIGQTKISVLPSSSSLTLPSSFHEHVSARSC